MKKMYGVVIPMITPFTEDDRIDVPTLKAYTNYLIERGVHCLYPEGTTGEMLKMSVEERKLVSETVVKQADGRTMVYIQVGCATTRDTVELAKHAHSIGADGIGVVTPQFFSVTDREMEEYFVTIANSIPSDFPVYLYCIPQCAANDIKPEVVDHIVKRTKNVMGIKYSFTDMIRIKNYLLCKNGEFSVMVGPDRLFLPALAMGCDGTVTGCANADPAPFVEVYKQFTAGNISAAQAAQKRATRLCEIVKNGSNMAIFKYALERNGLPASHMRAPALDLTSEEKEAIDKELDDYARTVI
jgi:4-hydroxy-tetrahydrodipicolinate synthase